MIIEEVLVSFGAEIKEYKAGEIIFWESEFSTFYYQIKEGQIKLNNYTEDGKEFIQNIFSNGH
ncbi:MAG: Crp/Fnr family transcriptional regulator, partial [Chryseobacterium sp.]|nr:Crp/Fnr family transcriptional regulator [Chryseobacterium sp.]